MHTADLVFQARSVALVDNRRSHEDQQVSLCPNIGSALKEIPEDWDVTHERNLGAGFRDFILEQPANRQRVAALDQDVRVQRACVDDRAQDRLSRAGEVKNA